MVGYGDAVGGLFYAHADFVAASFGGLVVGVVEHFGVDELVLESVGPFSAMDADDGFAVDKDSADADLSEAAAAEAAVEGVVCFFGEFDEGGFDDFLGGFVFFGFGADGFGGFGLEADAFRADDVALDHGEEFADV